MLLTDWFILLGSGVFLLAWFWRTPRWAASLRWLGPAVIIAAALLGPLTLRWQVLPPAIVAGLALLVYGLDLAAQRRGARPVNGTPWISGLVWAFALMVSLAPLLLMPVFSWNAPTGPHAVGFRTFEAADPYRKGVLEAAPNESRRFKVHVWYPATADGASRTRRYLEGNEIENVAGGWSKLLGLPEFALNHLGLVDTHALVDAPVAQPADGQGFPVVIFSHGFRSWPGQNQPLMEHLASKGYIVLAPYHSYDSMGVTFENGVRIPPRAGPGAVLRGPMGSRAGGVDRSTSAVRRDARDPVRCDSGFSPGVSEHQTVRRSERSRLAHRRAVAV